MSKAIFLKVGSFVLSIIIDAIVPSGKIYITMNPKYFMPLMFASFFTTFGTLFLIIHNLDIPINEELTNTLLINEFVKNKLD